MMGLPPGSTSWLFSQTVPLWAFVLALLTSPSKWSATVTSFVKKRVGGGGSA